jgi:hypothetical protein
MHLQLTNAVGPTTRGVSVIFSIGERRRTTRAVELVCPRCGLDRTGAAMQPSRWACLFGLPILPLGEFDPIVVCDECGHASDLGVLDVPTTERLAVIVEEATIAAVVAMVTATTGEQIPAVSERAVETVLEAGYGYSARRLAYDVATMSAAARLHRFAALRHEMTAHGKQGFLHRMTAVAMTDASITAAQRDAIVEIGCGLGMAAPHINGILAVAAVYTGA